MSRMVDAPVALPARVMTVVVLAATLSLLASPSRAGIRDLAKSAKDKAAKAAGQKPAEQKAPAEGVEFDDTMVELTGDLLDKLIACRKAAQPELKNRAGLVQRREALSKEIAELNDAHGGAIVENYNRRAEVENCVGMQLQEIRDRKMQEEMARLMANPRAGEKLAKLSLALQEAQARGDTAEFNRLTKQSEELFALTRADSLAAASTCAPMPGLHPAKVQIDGLEKELATIDEKLRELDKRALKIQVETCGMGEAQIAMAWERIELYLAKAAHDSTPGGFSATELQALSERKGALGAALKV